MIQSIADNPGAFLAFVLVIVLLQMGAAIRVRHDRNLKGRAQVDRRRTPRPGGDRRWVEQARQSVPPRYKPPR